MITLSLPLFILALLFPVPWWIPTIVFLSGWTLQFAGHAVEGKPPEFLSDWRFFLVGFSWWLTKVFRRPPINEDDSLSS